MGTDHAIYLLNEMVWNALMVAAPILLVTLFVGLLVSVFQVTTQLQDITLSYVPKILATAFLLIGLGPWMIGRVASFTNSLYQIIPGIT